MTSPPNRRVEFAQQVAGLLIGLRPPRRHWGGQAGRIHKLRRLGRRVIPCAELGSDPPCSPT